eukprot:CAMPEP_0181189410 /NCGR_PEP_ID=MMETSP1096-20121128/11644_1 /TAXON_ID=156174 ORGANISM="Chrysochromulina ericina, Strain CCMP281" /NCGR_SAMPLE_ID=MMETSP1096 /ASSEMBLY_ACC=CAM_ASM_000453 /LENGTH=120 /DNA_ID=CAMNT_0023278555 /DNA_START=197 /DNA_END=556 /DNA_ORIENTATION=-
MNTNGNTQGTSSTRLSQLPRKVAPLSPAGTYPIVRGIGLRAGNLQARHWRRRSGGGGGMVLRVASVSHVTFRTKSCPVQLADPPDPPCPASYAQYRNFQERSSGGTWWWASGHSGDAQPR